MITDNDFEIKTFDCPSCNKNALTSWHTGRINPFDLYYCKECGKKYRVEWIDTDKPSFVLLNTISFDSLVEKICIEMDNADFYFTGINDSNIATTYEVKSYPAYVVLMRINMTGGTGLDIRYYHFRLEKALLNGKSIKEQMEIVRIFFAESICKLNGFSEKSLQEVYI